MKKLITVFSILFLFILISCEESETIPEQRANIESADSDEVIFDELFQIEKGVLAFKDKESLEQINKYVFSSKNNLQQLATFLKNKSFDNLYSYYRNINDETLFEISQNRRLNAQLSKYFVLTSDDDGDLDLEEIVKATYLQLYFNKELSFKVGNDFVKIVGNRLVYEKSSGKIINSTSIVNQGSYKLMAKGVLDKKSSTTYDHGGKKYKLIVDTNTWDPTVLLYPNGGPLSFKTLVNYVAIHKRRNWGIYSRYGAPELSVYGNHYRGDTNTNTASWENFTSGIGSYDSEIGAAQYYINSYSATAKCKGVDQSYHYVSVSETF